MIGRSLVAAATAAAAGLQLAAAIPKISVTGAKFFDDTGKQFYVKGECTPYHHGAASELKWPRHRLPAR